MNRGNIKVECPKVSVIVPVYNVGNVLSRCIDSIINQTLTDLEIILVDDGSTDSSGIICDEYAVKDPRIRVIHKSNGGLSDARNTGLKIAKGKYILFVDSDDYINHQACEVLYKCAFSDDLDIVVGDAVKIEKQKKKTLCHSPVSLNKILTGKEFLKEQLKENRMIMPVVFNMYRRNFLIDNQLYFEKGLFHEDEEWTPRAFLRAKRVKYINTEFYYYVIRTDSITNKKNKEKNGIDLIEICYKLEKEYQKIQDDYLKKLLFDYLAMLFLNAIHLGDLYGKEYGHLYNKRFLIGKAKSSKNKIKVLIFLINKHLYKYLNKTIKYTTHIFQ